MRFAIAIVLFLFLCSLSFGAEARETYRTRIAKSLTMDALMKKVENRQPGELKAMFTSSGEFLKSTVGNTGIVVDVLTLGSHDEILDSLAGGVKQFDGVDPLNGKKALGDTAFWLTVAVDLLKAKDGKQVNKAFHDAFLEWGYNKASDSVAKVFGGLAVLPANLIKWFLGEVKSTVDTGVEQRLWSQYVDSCKDLLEKSEAGRRYVGRMIVQGTLGDELLRRFDEDMFLNTSTKGFAGWGAVELTKRHKEAFRDKFLMENKEHFELAAVEELQARIRDAMPALQRNAAQRLKETRRIFDKKPYFSIKFVDQETKEVVKSSVYWYLEANRKERGSVSASRKSELCELRLGSCKDVYVGSGKDEVVFYFLARGYKRQKVSVPLDWKSALDRKTGQHIGTVELEPSASALLDVSINSSTPKDSDHFRCSLSATDAAVLVKNAKGGKYRFRVEPGTYLLVAGESRHAVFAQKVTLKKGSNSEEITLTRLPILNLPRPKREALQKTLNVPSPMAAKAEAERAFNDLLTGGGSMEELNSMANEAGALAQTIRRVTDPHFCGLYWAQANSWAGSGTAQEKRYEKFNKWHKKYKEQCATMLTVLKDLAGKYNKKQYDAGNKLSEIHRRFNALREKFSKPRNWSSLRIIYLDQEVVEPVDVSSMKETIKAELLETLVSPEAMTIYELRSAANDSNPFKSRVFEANSDHKESQVRWKSAEQATEKLSALKDEMNSLLEDKGLLLQKAEISSRSIPKDLDYLQHKWRSYSGSKSPVSLEGRLNNDYLISVVQDISKMLLEGRAIELYYKTEVAPTEELRYAYQSAFNQWASWHERVKAQLQKEEAEEERIRAELLRLSKEYETAFNKLSEATSEVQKLRNKSDMDARDAKRMLDGGSHANIEAQKRSIAAVGNSEFQQKAIKGAKLAAQDVNRVRDLNYQLQRLSQHRAFNTMRQRPKLPSTYYGTYKNHYANRVNNLQSMVSKTKQNLATLKIASTKLDKANEQFTNASAMTGKLEKELEEGEKLLKAKAASATTLDGIAKAYPAQFFQETYKQLMEKVKIVEQGKVALTRRTRSLANGVKSQLQHVEYLTTRAITGFTRRWYSVFAKDYKAKKLNAVMDRLSEQWTCATESSKEEQRKNLEAMFAQAEFGNVKFELKSAKAQPNNKYRLTALYDVLVVGRNKKNDGQIYKVVTVSDVLLLTPKGVRIVSTSKAAWALMTKKVQFSQLHLGYGLMGRQGTYRYVSSSDMKNNSIILAGLANGDELTVKTVSLSTDGGANFVAAQKINYGNRALFHHKVSLPLGKDSHLVLKSENSKGEVTRWPQRGAFIVRAVEEPKDAIAVMLTKHLISSLNAKKADDVLAILSDNYYGGFSRLSKVLRREISTFEPISISTISCGSAGPWQRVVIEWRRAPGSMQRSCLFFNGAHRLVDIRGPLPFGNSDEMLRKSAAYPIDARVLRGRVRLDYSREMCERDKLYSGALFSHGLAIPCRAIKGAAADIVIRYPMILFASSGAITSNGEKQLGTITSLPNSGWTHALFRKEVGATFTVVCRNKKWCVGKIEKIDAGDDKSIVEFRYIFHDKTVALPKTN